MTVKTIKIAGVKNCEDLQKKLQSVLNDINKPLDEIKIVKGMVTMIGGQPSLSYFVIYQERDETDVRLDNMIKFYARNHNIFKNIGVSLDDVKSGKYRIDVFDDRFGDRIPSKKHKVKIAVVGKNLDDSEGFDFEQFIKRGLEEEKCSKKESSTVEAFKDEDLNYIKIRDENRELKKKIDRLEKAISKLAKKIH